MQALSFTGTVCIGITDEDAGTAETLQSLSTIFSHVHQVGPLGMSASEKAAWEQLLSWLERRARDDCYAFQGFGPYVTINLSTGRGFILVPRVDYEGGSCEDVSYIDVARTTKQLQLSFS